MALMPLRGRARPITAPPSQEKRKIKLNLEDYVIQAATVVSEDEEGQKGHSYSVTLEVDLSSGRVGTRRKEGLRSIILPVEGKDIPVLVQLVGRPLSVMHWVDESILEKDDLVAQLGEMEKERDELERKLDEMRKQVHFLVEGSR
jgi:hypothetical protein